MYCSIVEWFQKKVEKTLQYREVFSSLPCPWMWVWMQAHGRTGWNSLSQSLVLRSQSQPLYLSIDLYLVSIWGCICGMLLSRSICILYLRISISSILGDLSLCGMGSLCLDPLSRDISKIDRCLVSNCVFVFSLWIWSLFVYLLYLGIDLFLDHFQRRKGACIYRKVVRPNSNMNIF